MAYIEPGDEVILLEPFFDQYGFSMAVADHQLTSTRYLSNIQMPGGVIKYVPLRPPKNGSIRKTSAADWTFDWDTLEQTISPKTRMIVVNTPHNPVGRIFTADELKFIADLCVKNNIILVSDEVYDRLYYKDFVRTATISPEAAKLTLTVGSAGKNFYATGWRVGWVIGDPALIAPVTMAHTRICYSSPSLLQEAAAIGFERADELGFWDQTRREMQAKMARFCAVFDELGIPYSEPDGGYFVLANLGRVQMPKDYEFPPQVKDRPRDFKLAWWMIQELGLAAIPPTEFYTEQNRLVAEDWMRFAVCKPDEVLEDAKDRLRRLKPYLADP